MGLIRSTIGLALVGALGACSPSSPIVVVHVSGARSAAASFRLSLKLNDQAASRTETFAATATELNLELPEGSLGQLALQLDAMNCHDCITARATATQLVLGTTRYDLDMTLTDLPRVSCPSGSLLSPRWYYTPAVLDRGPRAGQVYIATGADLTVPFEEAQKTEIYDPVSTTSRPSQPLLGVGAHVKRLHDGRLIMAGGYDGKQDRYVDTTQLYDPVTDTLRLGAPLQMARSGHVTVILSDGRLLAAAGKVEPPRRETATAEIYDPATDKWTLVDSLVEPRLYSSALLLPNGKVLITGGINQQEVYPRLIEMFDPAAPSGSQWTSAGNLIQGRWNHSTFVLPDGKVLIIGGAVGDVWLDSAEIFDPNAPGSTATAVAPPLFTFAYSAFTALRNGSVLITGGGPGRATANTQIFNPATGRFEAGPTLSQPRADHAAVLLLDGSVLLVSGVSGPIVRDSSASGLLATERLSVESCP